LSPIENTSLFGNIVLLKKNSQKNTGFS